MNDELPGVGFSMESLGEDAAGAARQQLALIEKSLGAFRGPAEFPAMLDETYRAAHSLKSAIDPTRMPNVDRLARRLQDVVRAARSGSLSATAQLGTVLASVARIARDALDAVSTGGAEPLSAASAAASLEEMLANPTAWSVPFLLSGGRVQWARVDAARLTAAGEAAGDARAAAAAFSKAADHAEALTESFRSIMASQEVALQELREALPSRLAKVARGESTTLVAAELANMLNALSASFSGLDQSVARNSAVVGEASNLGTRASQRAEAAFGSLRSVSLDAILEDFPRLVRRAAGNVGRKVDLALEPTNLEVNASRAEWVGTLISSVVRTMISSLGTRGKTPRRVTQTPRSRLSVTASAEGEDLSVQVTLSGDAVDTGELKVALGAAERRLARGAGTLEVKSGKGEDASVAMVIRGAAAAASRSAGFVLARAGEAWYAIPESAVVECIEAGLSMAQHELGGVRLPTLRMNDTRDPRVGVVVRTPRGGALLLFDVIGGREFGVQSTGGSGANPAAGISGSVRRPDGSSALLVDLRVLLPAPHAETGHVRAPRGHATARRRR